MADETMTQLLHRLTSYEPGREWTDVIADDRLVQGLVPNDFNRFPRFYKHYDAGLPTIALPREYPTSSAPATDVLAGTYDAPRVNLELLILSRILHLSAGVTRTAQRRGRNWLFRAAGSAGARFPLELYICVPDGASLPPGVHWYHPAEHALVQIAHSPLGESPAIVVTGVPWRTGWRYRERGFRHIYWDAGTMLAQLLAVADSAGLNARLFTGFPDGRVSDLVGADGIDEFPVAVVALGPGDPALDPIGPAVPGHLDADGIEFPLITAAQHAGDQDRLGVEIPRGAPVDVVADGAALTLDEVVLRRGSTRLLDPNRSVPRQTLVASMATAMRGIDVPHWVAVNAVDDLEPGLYRWPELNTPIRAGLLRDELYRAALEQGLASDAGFVVISGIDLADVDDRRYREAQLLAGIVEGRLHLMAFALGLGASGMTFQDSDIPALLQQDVASLLWTCVGVPEYESRPGGQPGTPSEVRILTPRGA